MTTSFWKLGVSGSWTTGSNWNGGVPTASSDVFVNKPGTYSITLATNGLANSLSMSAAGATLLVNGSLTITNGFSLQNGTAVLNGVDSIGSGVTQSGGLLKVGNAAALGSSAYTISGGEFLGTATESIANTFNMSGFMTFAAAHSTVLSLNTGTNWHLNATNPTSLTFGEGGNDGTITWYTMPGSSINNSGHYAVNVSAGTLRAGDGSFSFLTGDCASVAIQTGATIDQAGFAGEFIGLGGAGTVANSGAAALVEVIGGSFSGVIQDALTIEVLGAPPLILSGTNTYNGGTMIDAGASLQLGIGGPTGSVVGDIIDNGSLTYDLSGAVAATNGISGTGAVAYEGGATFTINHANSYSGTTLVSGGGMSISDGGAFGTGALTLAGTQFLATANLTLGGTHLTVQGTTEFAAAHGKVLTNVIAGQKWSLDGGATGAALIIGDAVNNGTVLWNTGAGSSIGNFPLDTVEIRGGTFKAGDNAFNFLTDTVGKMMIDAGATVDLNGFTGGFANLSGTGAITGTGGANVFVFNSDFDGVITGTVTSEMIGSVFLGGNSTYSGATTIDSGAVLSLGKGGTTGGVAGDIVDNGDLYYNHSNKVTVTAAISGTGAITQFGTGTTIINRAETYSGGTHVVNGVLSIGESDAIGSGALFLDGGAFVSTSTFGLANTLDLSGDVTIGANKNTTLTLNTTNGWTLDVSNPASITFGDSGHSGIVVWDTPGTSQITALGYTVAVNGGTLRAGDNLFGYLTGNADSTAVGGAGTLDVAGFGVLLVNLLGSGQIIDSGAAAMLTISGGNFSGKINGGLTLDIQENVTLTGGGSYNGPLLQEAGSTLNLTDTAARTVNFEDTASLNINNASGKAETLTLNLSFIDGDFITGGAGNETLNLGSTLRAGHQIDGGAGTDVVNLDGDYADDNSLALDSTTLLNIETLTVAKGHNYDITTADATVAAGKTLTVDASALKASNTLTFDGSSETDGHLKFTGGLGGDHLTGGALSDTFIYSLAGQSTSTHYDTISGFNFGADRFDTPGANGTITAIDAAVSHAVSSGGSFDSDLAAAVSGHLNAHTAMLVNAVGGSLSGQVFLVVDLDGTAGYQSGTDLVIDMVGATGTLVKGDFI